jgi:hypothetical protein
MKSIDEFQRKRFIELGETKLGVPVPPTAEITGAHLLKMYACNAVKWLVKRTL